jgi:hypothetical protein
MTNSEFHQANIDWAKKLLSQPEYTMPNGKSSHQIAYAELNKAIDARLKTGRVDAFGHWI